MGSLPEFVRVSHGMGSLLWFVQGNKPDEWFTARTWQQTIFNAFYASHHDSYDFINLKTSYRLQSVQLGILLKNLETGMVRLVHQCDCSVFSHKGSTVNSVSLLQVKDTSSGQCEVAYKVDTDQTCGLDSIVRNLQVCTVSPASVR